LSGIGGGRSAGAMSFASHWPGLARIPARDIWSALLAPAGRPPRPVRLLATMISDGALQGQRSVARRDNAADGISAARFRDRMLPHLDAAHNLARYLSRDPDAAQDIVQDAFLRAFRSFATYRGEGERAWILSIVRNCHRDWRAQQKRDAVVEPLSMGEGDGGEERDDLPLLEETPETDLLRRDEAAAVRRQLEAMPEPFREVLVLREMEDLSYREIAEAIGLPIGTVMSRLARARSLFQKTWQPSGLQARTSR
jgi:RNA polymerase sigma factor (sigma-70 family)